MILGKNVAKLIVSNILKSILTCATVVPGPHQLLGSNLVLAGHQFVNGILVIQEQLHPDERLATFLRQHMPWLRSGQEV